MADVAFILLVLAAAFAAGRLARRHVPELVAYLVVGALLGPTGLGVIDRHTFEHLRPLVQAATAVLMFLVGERLSLGALRAGRWISAAAAGGYLATGAAVYGLTTLAGAPQSLAVILGVLAGGGAPMTVAALVASRGHRDPYGESLVAVHAACDVLAAMTFAFVLPAVVLRSEHGHTVAGAVGSAIRLGLAGAALGTVLGLVLAQLEPRVGRRELVAATAALLAVGTGLSLAVGLSVPLVAVVFGAVAVTRLPAPRVVDVFRPFDRVEGPLYVFFFGLAGAAIRLNTLPRLGLVGLAYIGARSIGKVSTGAAVRDLRFGLDTLPQAGISVALAAVASAALPGHGIATVTLGSVVVFEIVGAMIVRAHLARHAGLVAVTDPARAA